MSLAHAPDLLEGVDLLGAGQGTDLIRQCSRQSPEGGAPFWTPAPTQVHALERQLRAVLDDNRAKHAAYIAQENERFGANANTAFHYAERPREWHRQFVGYTLGERRMIYGNFAPGGMGHSGERTAMVVCDGGPQFFGVEYDVEANRVTRIAFNGGRGGPFLDSIVP